MLFSAKTRADNIEKLKNTKLDLLIIGGGITGAGITVEAGAMGMTNGLIEMQDFAAGTSSRSTKLIHGGLRYLKQFEVEIVSEVASEREIIYNNASHIVKPAPMVLPIYDEEGASFDTFSAKVALDLYDRLSDVQEEYKNYFLDKEKALEKEPTLKKEGLHGAGIYLDYTSDDARLTVELLKKANEVGSLLANYVKATAFTYDEEGKINGVKAEDQLTGEAFEIQAEIVINAAGPWSDDVRHKNEGSSESRIRPTKGIHLVVDHALLPVQSPVYFDSGVQDDRMIFAIPRKNKTYFGTTDTDYKGDLTEPGITKEDIEYLLKAVNHRFENLDLKTSDINASWSGVRPLIQEKGKDPSAVSRGSSLTESPTGLLTIAGGKLTDYRRMANGTIQLIKKRLQEKTGKDFPMVDTKVIKVSGGDVPIGSEFESYAATEAAKGTALGLSEAEAETIVKWYGSNASNVFAKIDHITSFNGLNLGDALSLRYALENEMTLTPTDYFLRRTDLLLFNIDHLEEIKTPVIEEMARFYNWDKSTKNALTAELEEKIKASNLSKSVE